MSEGAPIRMRAFLLAERIDTRGLARAEGDTGVDPVAVRLGNGHGFVFRAGAAAHVGLSEEEAQDFLLSLAGRLRNPFRVPSSEDATLVVRPDDSEQGLPEGAIAVRGLDLPRLTVVADVLAKAAALNSLEEIVQTALTRVEPFAEQLAQEGRPGAGLAELNRRLGAAMVAQHRMVGRFAIAEKPEVLWDHPQLERLYARLEAEYELNERAAAVERKIDLLRSTTSTVTDLIQNRSAHRLEWAIIGLIALEIVLSLYDRLIGAG